MLKDAAARTSDERLQVVHAIRMAQRVVKSRDILKKLFDTIGPQMANRPGGYLRIIKAGHRHGDAAPMAIVELVGMAVR